MTPIQKILTLGPCLAARRWLASLPEETSWGELIAQFEVGEWGYWLLEVINIDIPSDLVRRVLLRRIEEAEHALQTAKLFNEAEILSAFPVTSYEEIHTFAEYQARLTISSSLQLAHSLWQLARTAYWAQEGSFLSMARAASSTFLGDAVEAELQAEDIRDLMPDLAAILETFKHEAFV